MSDRIIGRNPVLEALKSGRDMEKIILAEGVRGSAAKIISLAKERGVPFSFAGGEKLDELAGGGKHQGVVAFVSAREYSGMEDVYALAEARGEPPFIVVLDGIEDPHNLGAVIRTCECAGVHGVVIRKRRAAGLTAAAVKASAGAAEHIPCVRVANIASAVEDMKERGLWIAACVMDGEVYCKCDLRGPIALVIGNEGRGVSRLDREK